MMQETDDKTEDLLLHYSLTMWADLLWREEIMQA
jgi:hypothetical protein